MQESGEALYRMSGGRGPRLRRNVLREAASELKKEGRWEDRECSDNQENQGQLTNLKLRPMSMSQKE